MKALGYQMLKDFLLGLFAILVTGAVVAALTALLWALPAFVWSVLGIVVLGLLTFILLWGLGALLRALWTDSLWTGSGL